jgi:hypothetical protein
MTLSSSLRVLLATVGVAVVALTASGAAQAQNNNVYWSVGMSAPGMQVGVANAPPVVMYPQVAYPQAYPQVYSAPRPVGYYGNNGYYTQPAPVYYAPPVWQPRFGYGHHVGYGYGHREQERFEHGRGGWGGGHEGGHRR